VTRTLPQVDIAAQTGAFAAISGSEHNVPRSANPLRRLIAAAAERAILKKRLGIPAERA
jgi:hypothetical protein